MERNVAQIALFAALIAVLGVIPPVALPFTGGVPITAQSLGVMMAGLFLGRYRGAIAVCLFLLVVALGAPLLSGGRGGLGVFAGPTVGFLIGWPIAAFFIGWIFKVGCDNGMPFLVSGGLSCFVGGIVILYAIGIVGVVLVTGADIWKVTVGSAAFVPGDIVKAVVATLLAKAVHRARPSLVAV